MFLLANNVVFVSGAYCGAIYDFNTKNVFSVNHETNIFLQKLKNKNISLDTEQLNYIKLLKENNLYNEKFFGNDFNHQKPEFNQFNTVWLELTMGCNCRCLHCYEGSVHNKSNESLTLDEWFDVIDQIYKIGTKRIILIGGEPCLYRNIINIIEKIYSYKIEILLFTNATLFSKELIEVIIKYNVKVKVSIYGHNADLHDKITQNKGSFEKLYSNIKTLINNNIEVTPSVIIMKENQNYINDIEIFIKEMGLKWNGYDIIREVGCGKNKQHCVSKEIMNFKIRTKPSFSTSKEFFIDTIYSNNCWKNKIVISENGDVLPCVFARTEICGNVKKDTIKSILNNKLSDYWNYDFSNIDICKDCEYRFACKDCRPVAMSDTGNINSHTKYCKYNPYKGEWYE